MKYDELKETGEMSYYEAMKKIHADCRQDGDYKTLHDKGVKLEYASRRYNDFTRPDHYVRIVEGRQDR